MAEDAWNTRDPEHVALAYTDDSRWRNRAEFYQGRRAIVEFLKRKWAKELDYRLISGLWPSLVRREQFAWRALWLVRGGRRRSFRLTANRCAHNSLAAGRWLMKAAREVE
jgi:uncharacterized protein